MDGEVRISLHHRRKIREIIDCVIEDIQRQIQDGKCKSYLEFGTFFLRYNGQRLDLSSLDAPISEVFGDSSQLEVVFEQSNTLSALVSEKARKMALGELAYQGGEQSCTHIKISPDTSKL